MPIRLPSAASVLCVLRLNLSKPGASISVIKKGIWHMLAMAAQRVSMGSTRHWPGPGIRSAACRSHIVRAGVGVTLPLAFIIPAVIAIVASCSGVLTAARRFPLPWARRESTPARLIHFVMLPGRCSWTSTTRTSPAADQRQS